jgi:hypothetical protein
MNSTDVDRAGPEGWADTRNRSRLFAPAVIAAASVMLLTFAAPAFAALNTWYSVPGYYGASAKAKMTSYSSGYTGTRASGSAYIDPAGTCVYVSLQPVARYAVDGGWRRATSNACSGSGRYLSWSESSTLRYDGYKFRLCRDINNAPDTCAYSTSATIYR